MELYKRFDELIFDASSLPVANSAKEPLIIVLQFLRSQAQSDLHQQSQKSHHKEAWLRAEWHFRRLNFQDHFRKTDEFYDPIYRFVGAGPYAKSSTVVIPFVAPASRYAGPHVEKIFKEWLEALEQVEVEIDRDEMEAHLGFLLHHAKLPKNKRDQASLHYAWSQLLPLLKKHRLISKSNEEQLNESLLYFLKGGIA